MAKRPSNWNYSGVPQPVVVVHDPANPFPADPESNPNANPSSAASGAHTVTAGAATLPAKPITTGVFLKAAKTNQGITMVGGSDGQNFPLAAGEGVSLAISDASAVFIKGTAGDIVYWIAT